MDLLLQAAFGIEVQAPQAPQTPQAPQALQVLAKKRKRLHDAVPTKHWHGMHFEIWHLLSSIPEHHFVCMRVRLEHQRYASYATLAPNSGYQNKVLDYDTDPESRELLFGYLDKLLISFENRLENFEKFTYELNNDPLTCFRMWIGLAILIGCPRGCNGSTECNAFPCNASGYVRFSSQHHTPGASSAFRVGEVTGALRGWIPKVAKMRGIKPTDKEKVPRIIRKPANYITFRAAVWSIALFLVPSMFPCQNGEKRRTLHSE